MSKGDSCYTEKHSLDRAQVPSPCRTRTPRPRESTNRMAWACSRTLWNNDNEILIIVFYFTEVRPKVSYECEPTQWFRRCPRWKFELLRMNIYAMSRIASSFWPTFLDQTHMSRHLRRVERLFLPAFVEFVSKIIAMRFSLLQTYSICWQCSKTWEGVAAFLFL